MPRGCAKPSQHGINKAVSYKEFLAEEAQRSTERAQAEAEVAARNAKAVAEAQRQLLEEIEQWNEPAPDLSAGPETLFGEMPVLEIVEPVEEIRSAQRDEERGEPARAEESTRGVELRLLRRCGFAGSAAGETPEWMARGESYRVSSVRTQAAAEELAELDEEIEFRLAPEFPDLVLETQSIPGNIIEFPRELVASRKARPRLAEGPLLADGTPEPQLRIFEVEPEQYLCRAGGCCLAEAPEWQGMMLGAGPSAEPRDDLAAA